MSQYDNTCPCCGEVTLVHKTKKRNITYLGTKGHTDMYYSNCTNCGCDQVSGWQVQVNRDNMLTFHRTVERFLRGEK